MSMNELISKTEYILRAARAEFSNPVVLWSGGKDSTALLYMIARTFRRFPFDVIHLDNGREFPETYNYMKKIRDNLNFNLIRQPIEIKYDIITGLTCCGNNKTEALKKVISSKNIDAVIVSIRRDEHGIRGMERYFSPRTKEFMWKIYNPERGEYGEALQDPEFIDWGITVSDFGKDCDHVRIHPLLHWTEIDIWKYIKYYKIPVNPLYFSKNGKRFRSIGCMDCSVPIPSSAKNIDEIIKELTTTKIKEREGRMQDKELAMERLRALGYM